MRGPNTARVQWPAELAAVAGMAIAKALVSASMLAGGFRAVSDDDFARVLIAQRWSVAPTLDPTGSSWLPWPFYLLGGWMKLFGATLESARAHAFFMGIVAALILYAAARCLEPDRRLAWLGAALGAALPWSARLGVATVPELPTAALMVFGAATLARPGKVRALGGLALSLAALSRYEAWPVALGFATLCAIDARRRDSARGAQLAAATLALVGPALWLSHNAVNHGHPLHFAIRVSEYRRDLGSIAASFVGGYPLALVRDEPELTFTSAALAIGALRRRAFPDALRRPAVVIGGGVGLLVLAGLAGSAPTHHAGRGLLAAWLLAAIAVPRGLRAMWRERRRSTLIWLSGLLAIAIVVRVTSSTYADLPDRTAEVQIGDAIRERTAEDARVLLDMRGYRHHALQVAAFPRFAELDPERPRRSAFEPAERADPTLRDRAARHGMRYIVTEPLRAGDALGPPLLEAGDWALYDALSPDAPPARP